MIHDSSLQRASKGAGGEVTAIAGFGAAGWYAAHGKRVLDLALLALVAPVAAPLVLLLCLLTRFDGGPALYAQPRVGRGGRLFRCWKIRSMVVDADDKLEAYLQSCPEARVEWDRDQKLRHDPRVTAFGHFLRSTSLDELPQLWNILTGEMSFVGPRPFTPNQIELYRGVSYYSLRPGLTGPWQVGERNHTSFGARAAYDTSYARDLSLAHDLGILLRTVRVVLWRTGR
ncbi:MAG: sugar transferase [Pseudomonadota bacterium]|nr:sugar transferase [Pseudomonadota bacterium]MEE3101307.1 sugar transferase [Pseudomonadota bacterium]